MTANTLIIRHVGSDPDRFEVMRLTDGKRTQAVAIQPPDRFPVQGRPNSNLTKDLRWYLEDFLDYPFPPDTDVAARVQESLIQWGEQAFNALFDNREGGVMLNAAMQGHYHNLTLQISGSDPHIFAWPWEALRDPRANYLAHTCQIERRLNAALDPPPLSQNLPKEHINILLVTARPYENDVRYRSISRLLVELIDRENLPARVHILRPPTFDALRKELRRKPNYYHILHFDGHGAYGNVDSSAASSGFTFKGKEGCLVFETEKGAQDPIRAEQLSALLRESAIPAVVLNACQSAMIDPSARNEFASVAASLIQSGVRSVVAMAWSLYVSGAQTFLPQFYSRLFETGKMAQAVRAGRRQMLASPRRVCPREKHPLDDWIVPVIYQQDPMDFTFDSQPDEPSRAQGPQLPPEIEDSENPYGFIGRDGPILELERALRRKPPAVLIHGLGGVGKTTLAKGFIKWLAATQGLSAGCFWFPFDQIRSAEYMINRMGEALFDGNFSLAAMEERLAALTSALKQHSFVIVWDNFEVVCGIPGTGIAPCLPEEDQKLLQRFLSGLRGSPTKVLITSRSREQWLAGQCVKVGLTGLEGEERWLLLEEIVDQLGLAINRDDPQLVKLMDLLAGHPLSMRVVLPLLEERSAAKLMEAVAGGMEIFKQSEDDANARLYATLEVAGEALPQELRPLLIPLGLHEAYLHLGILQAVAAQVDPAWTRNQLDRFAHIMVHMGLIYPRRSEVYELHPALTGFLRSGQSGDSRNNVKDAWARAFVGIMGTIAGDLSPKPLHEQRGAFHLFGAGFHHAMAEAQRLEMHADYRAILKSLAIYAQNTLNFSEAKHLFQKYAEAHQETGTPAGEAAAYHQLGMIAEEQRDFQTAEKWYRKSLEIEEKQGNEDGSAGTYHHLGRIAQEQRDFQNAEKWFRKALEIFERRGNEHNAAKTYHHLGMIAREHRDFRNAEEWYRKSLEIEEKYGDKHGAAITYQQLGNTAYYQLDFQNAEQWYRKSLEIFEGQSYEHGVASIYNWLGNIVLIQQDFQSAERWYRKAIEIFERQNNEHDAAIIYHQLGNTAHYQWDFQTSEQWYRKSLEINERQGNEHGAARTYRQLGILFKLKEEYEISGQWLIRSIQGFANVDDNYSVQLSIADFITTYQAASTAVHDKLQSMWVQAGLGDFESLINRQEPLDPAFR